MGETVILYTRVDQRAPSPHLPCLRVTDARFHVVNVKTLNLFLILDSSLAAGGSVLEALGAVVHSTKGLGFD